MQAEQTSWAVFVTMSFGAKKVVSLSHLNELRGIRLTKEGGLRIGALTTLTEVAGQQDHPGTLPGPCKGCFRGGQPPASQPGDHRRKPLSETPMLVLPGRISLPAQGRGQVLSPLKGENQFHCIFGSGGICYIVHPSDIAPALVAFEATARVVGPKGTRSVPLEKFHVLPSEDPQRETVLKTE